MFNAQLFMQKVACSLIGVESMDMQKVRKILADTQMVGTDKFTTASAYGNNGMYLSIILNHNGMLFVINMEEEDGVFTGILG